MACVSKPKQLTATIKLTMGDHACLGSHKPAKSRTGHCLARMGRKDEGTTNNGRPCLGSQNLPSQGQAIASHEWGAKTRNNQQSDTIVWAAKNLVKDKPSQMGRKDEGTTNNGRPCLGSQKPDKSRTSHCLARMGRKEEGLQRTAWPNDKVKQKHSCFHTLAPAKWAIASTRRQSLKFRGPFTRFHGHTLFSCSYGRPGSLIFRSEHKILITNFAKWSVIEWVNAEVDALAKLLYINLLQNGALGEETGIGH